MMATVVFLHVLLLSRPRVADVAKVSLDARPAVMSNALASLMVDKLQRMVRMNVKLVQD
jgi:hypothetical protein